MVSPRTGNVVTRTAEGSPGRRGGSTDLRPDGRLRVELNNLLSSLLVSIIIKKGKYLSRYVTFQTGKVLDLQDITLLESVVVHKAP